MINLVSTFTGIGAFEKVLTNLNVPYDLLAFSEIDPYAIKSYCAVHGVDPNKNLGSISEVTPEALDKRFLRGRRIDILTGGFPCQDISKAGYRKGFIQGSGTRSSLLWDLMRLTKELEPTVLITENVKNLVQGFYPDFLLWLEYMYTELGYVTQFYVLNSGNYGSAQARERVFTISVKKGIPWGDFNPEAFNNHLPLNPMKSILEASPDKEDVYYLNQVKHPMIPNPNPSDSKYLSTKYLIPSYKYHETQKVYDIDFLSPTLLLKNNFWIEDTQGIIRNLSPLEAWRLQGFSNIDFYRAKPLCTKSQLLRQAGNSIEIKTLTVLMKEILKIKGLGI